MKNLVIVESNAKASKIKGYLDSKFPEDNWQVNACLGHICDLPNEEKAVNPDDWEDLKWADTTKGKKVIKELTKLCKENDSIFLATDPDREGEAIAWHLNNKFEKKKLLKDKAVSRISFTEITPSAIEEAIKNPREIDQNLVNAYLARRILDHLIGFKVSPFLWRHISRAKSAGRVQSPSLRIVCEKEDEIDAFTPEEFWPFSGKFNYKDFQVDADLTSINGEKTDKKRVSNEIEAKQIENELTSQSFYLKEIESKPQSNSSKAPFRTSTLQQAASSKLSFTADRTMRVAQKLYEDGLITYLRTDGISISNDILNDLRNFISSEYGEKYLSEKPKIYKSKAANSQEAHEPIRPTDFSIKPSKAKLTGDEMKLYSLIWNRTLASQMSNSKYERKTLVISSKDEKYIFRAASRKNLFLGFELLTKEEDEDGTATEFPENLKEQEELILKVINFEQKFTSPPRRYSEASLIKKMEEEGIGRPSTYASILKNLREKKYTYGAKSITPSDLGRVLSSYLKFIFKDFFIEDKFTADMEKDLDKISSGEMSWTDVLDKFWELLQSYLNKKVDDVEISNKEEFKTRQVLDILNQELFHQVFPTKEDGTVTRSCPKCGEEVSLKSGSWGYFIGCSSCKWTKKPFDNSIKWETYQELPKEIGLHPDHGSMIFADLSINGPCVWTTKDEKKIYGAPDEDEDLLEIGLNRAVDLIERDSGENILFTEPNSNLPVLLKNGRFGEYTEFDGFNKATKLPPEDKPKNPKVTYYNPHELDYLSKETQIFVMKSLRILGFHPDSSRPIGIKIKKPGKAFKFVKYLKCGDVEVECQNDFYKLEDDEKVDLVKKTFGIEKFNLIS